MLKNRHDPVELTEAIFHARLCCSAGLQLLKNIHPCNAVTLVSFLFTDEKIFSLTTPKNPQNSRLYASVNQNERRRDKTPAVRTLLTFSRPNWWRQSKRDNLWLS